MSIRSEHMREAFRAKSVITLAGESPARTRKELEAPLSELDGGVIVADNDRVLAVESFAAFKKGQYSGAPLTDLGEVRLAPALINAHCHLELSHLAGAILDGAGFVSWLQSLIPQASKPIAPDVLLDRIREAVRRLADSGVAHIGDVGSRNPALVALAAGGDCGVTHFLEVLGYAPPDLSGRIPEDLAAEGYCPEAAASLPPERHEWCAVSGHALYSTSPEGLRAAFGWCRERQRPYSIHLAEFQEEDDCIHHGKGALHDIMRKSFLPPDWACPRVGPVEYADALGLLGPNTLAVHCVCCSTSDLAILARARASVCLCPRSNDFIGVGRAPAVEMAEAGLLLCLGTDSLASNHDLDMRREMSAARAAWGFSHEAVLRMATVNAAHALGLGHLGALMPGRSSAFSVW